MNKFISKSKYNKQILHSGLLAIELPVNILIIGNSGLGKKLLANELSKNTLHFDALLLEELINLSKINLEQYTKLIIYNINNIINKDEFFKNIKHIKIIATSNLNFSVFSNIFAVKLELKDLQIDNDDFIEIKNNYIKEAIYLSNNKNIDESEIKYDLTNNAISLKKSIFKHIFQHSLDQKDISHTLEQYLYKELKKNKSYKELLGLFEIPLLNASSRAFKSQVKISEQLKINRITLRKKIDQYFG